MDEIIPDLDYEGVVTDEVALEGLDGITLSALWTRIENRPKFTMVLDADIKSYFWDICVRQPGFQFYELPEARGPLIILKRFTSDDDEDAVDETKLDDTAPDIYPFCEIDEPNVYGSCSTYYTRVNVTDTVRGSADIIKMSLEEAESRWGEKLVIVASYELRKRALIGDQCDPLWQFNSLQYILLERIGRSRYQGELTVGKNSLSKLLTCAKSLFYYRMALLNKGIITKQCEYLKSKEGFLRSVLLLHLTRFYVEHKSRMVKLTEDMCKHLLEKQGRMDSVQNMLTAMRPIKRETFMRCIKKIANIKMISYCEFKELSGQDVDKHIPNNKSINVAELFDNLNLHNLDLTIEGGFSKEEVVEEDGLDTEMIECINKKSSSTSDVKPVDHGIPDCSNQLVDETVLRQGYHLFNKLGAKGASVTTFGSLLGVPRLESRLICNNLHRLKLLAITRRDVGRQRESVFVARRYVHDSRQQIYIECEKFIDLISGQKTESTEKSIATENDLSVEGKKLIERKLAELIKKCGGKSKSKVTRKGEKVKQKQTTKKGKMAEQKKPTKEDELVDHGDVTKEQQCTIKEDSIKTGEPMETDNAPKANEEVKEAEAPKTEEAVEKGQILAIDASRKTQPSKTLLEDIRMLLNANTKSTSTVTLKTLKRINIVLQAVRKAKLIDTHVTLHKLIVNKEAEESGGKMALKSFHRILKRLASEGFIKSVHDVITIGGKEKKIHLICDNSLESDDPLITSALDQAKLKFQAAPNISPTEEKPLDQINSSISQLRNLYKKEEEHQPRIYSSLLGRSYGHEPKFIRCRLFHEFLYYLTFGYEGKDDFQPPKQILDCDSDTLPKIYHYDTEVTWKTFVAKLPSHYGWGPGWCLMSDVLLRLPMSLLVRIVCYNFKVYGIEEYLNHPVKCHIPICYLPLNLRNQLLYSRKYIHATFESAQKLFYMGLLSFGPTEHKSKDMVFLFLHSKARVLDTTSSRPGYHKTSEDIEYPIQNYNFESMSELHRYWNDLETVCRRTPLGSNYIPTDSDMMVMIDVIEKKIEIKPIQPSESSEKEADTGIPPGDHLGAGGLDSSFFSHLNRSWNWSHPRIKVRKLKPLKSDKQSQSKVSTTVSVKWKDVSRMKFPLNAKNRMARLVINKQLTDMGTKKQGQNAPPTNRPATVIPSVKQGIQANSSASRNKQKTIRNKGARMLKPRKATKLRSPMYDEVDLMALAGVNRKRVRWHAKEDSLLLLCKVAYVLMFDNRRNGLSCRWIRDYLHTHSDVSNDKTSLACARRINYMLKNLQTGYHISVYVGESRQDKEISSLCEGLHLFSPVTDKDVFKERFGGIMARLMSKFKSASIQPSSNAISLPTTLAKLRSEYEIAFAKDYWGKSSVCLDVENEDGILSHLTYSLILSAVAGFTSDEQRLSEQLYDVFKQFPDATLLDSLNRLKSSGIISCKKPKMRRKEVHSSPVFGTLTYRLSIHYINMLRNKYPEDIFTQMNDMMHQLQSNAHEQPQQIVIDQNAGYAMTIVSLTANRKINFDVVIPDEIVTLGLAGLRKDSTSVTKSQEKNLASDKELTGDNELSCDKELTIEIDSLTDEPPQKKQRLECDDNDVEMTAANAENLVQVESAHNKVAFKPASKSSRLALYMLRQDMEEIALRTVQHTQDYLIIKPCSISCKLNAAEPDIIQVKTKSRRELSEYLPTQSINLSDIENHYKQLGKSEQEIETMCDIYNTIYVNGEMGVRYEDLRTWYGCRYSSEELRNMSLNAHLNEMETVKGILKVGVSTVRYVAHLNADSWTLRSYRVLPGVAPQPKENPAANDSNVAVTSNAKSKKEVCFIPKVWRRPDGTLNFPVFKQLLISVFGRIMSNPGVSFDKLYAHFKNVFTPFQLRELLSILIELRSVNGCSVKQSNKPTLFSPHPIHEMIVNGEEWSGSVCYEPELQGPQRLSSFLYDIVGDQSGDEIHL